MFILLGEDSYSSGSGPLTEYHVAGKMNGECWLMPKGNVLGVGIGPCQPRTGIEVVSGKMEKKNKQTNKP